MLFKAVHGLKGVLHFLITLEEKRTGHKCLKK